MIGARVEQPIGWEVDRIAKETGLTRSQVVNLLLKEAVHQELHIRHAVMLAPLVRTTVLKAMQGLLPLLISIAYDTNQTRHLTGNVLAKHTKPEELDNIRERTAKKAKESILKRRPEFAELVAVAGEWLAAFERGEETEDV